MAYAITQTCCKDASCVSVCPVNCIHPTPGEADFATAEMLYVDPRVCIDCGACADACPVDAVVPVDALRGGDAAYAAINADHFAGAEPDRAWSAPTFPRALPRAASLRVAVVGTGPAGCYTAQELLRTTTAEVTMIDRLDEPGGLVRYGVAPDHPSTKRIGETFTRLFRHPRTTMRLGVEVGVDVTHAELAAQHDAVVYAVGASSARSLGIPGEDRPGSLSATQFVNWYNGHPDAAGAVSAEDLATERAVVVGNGNVALDVARILLTDPEELAGTTIAPRALAALRASLVREVVVLGRRGPDDAAYSRPELRAMHELSGVEVVLDDGDESVAAEVDDAAEGSKAAMLRGVTRRAPDWSADPEPGRRIVFRFRSAPQEVVGDGQDGRVGTVRVRASTDSAGPALDLRAGLLLRSVGYRGVPVADLPFDEASATVPHERGRVQTPTLGTCPGTYVVGWIKRGPSGGIGTNRADAEETVAALLADAGAR